MIEGLMLQDPETESVGELLRRYEEADAAGSIPGDEDGHDFTAEQLTGEARTLASIPGVRRLALSHPNSQCVVRGERVLDAGGEESAFHDLAVGFRRSASVSAKRLGIGQFQEAELEWDGGALLAFSGGRTVLTVEMTAEVRRDGIRDTARVMVGSWSESRSAGAMSS